MLLKDWKAVELNVKLVRVDWFSSGARFFHPFHWMLVGGALKSGPLCIAEEEKREMGNNQNISLHSVDSRGILLLNRSLKVQRVVGWLGGGEAPVRSFSTWQKCGAKAARHSAHQALNKSDTLHLCSRASQIGFGD